PHGRGALRGRDRDHRGTAGREPPRGRGRDRGRAERALGRRRSMTVTLDTPIYQPGQTADVTTGQMLAYVYAGGKEPAYARAVMERIVTRWAYWSDFFGFVRSLTFGQACHE